MLHQIKKYREIDNKKEYSDVIFEGKIYTPDNDGIVDLPGEMKNNPDVERVEEKKAAVNLDDMLKKEEDLRNALQNAQTDEEKANIEKQIKKVQKEIEKLKDSK